jgi:enoyl-CoA hydratase
MSTAPSDSLPKVEDLPGVRILRLNSPDNINRLSRNCVASLAQTIKDASSTNRALVITGNDRCFSAGADLNEVAALDARSAAEFSRIGQELVRAIEQFRAPVIAAISGPCMGGGFDLALACHRRIASPSAVLGHRGAALGLITGWGGTQRLPRLVGKARAFQMLVAAEKVSAHEALACGLIQALADDPVAEAIRQSHVAHQLRAQQSE